MIKGPGFRILALRSSTNAAALLICHSTLNGNDKSNRALFYGRSPVGDQQKRLRHNGSGTLGEGKYV